MSEKKFHLCQLSISYTAIKHNIAFFRKQLKADCGIMLMVKASAYGNGAVEIAKRVEQDKLVEYLAVAYTDEGIELRKAGIELPILVLNPSKNAFEAMIKHCLEPEIYSLDHLKDFQDQLIQSGLENGNYPVHLKLNTGMNRLGMDEINLAELIDLLQNSRGWECRSVMTHLSCSGNPDEDDYTHAQLELFEKLKSQLSPYLPKTTWYHALNSNGIFRFPEYQFQMVRLGIGMYGGSAVPKLMHSLQTICKLSTKVSQIRTVEKGTSIGYGRAGKTTQKSNIATLAIGYADGFNRNLGNGNWEVEINGKLYPTIGNICMDLCMIDLGADKVNPESEVLIFGGQKSIHDYAEAQQTITYEAMTNISARVNKVIVD